MKLFLKKLIEDEEKYKKKYKKLNTKKTISIITNKVIGILGIGSGIILSLTGVGAVVGVTLIGASLLLVSCAVTVINEYISRMKQRYLRLRMFVNEIKIQYEKLLKKSLIDKFIDEKEGTELKKLYDFYLNNKKKIKTKTKTSIGEIFGDTSENIITKEQLEKLSSFLANAK